MQPRSLEIREECTKPSGSNAPAIKGFIAYASRSLCLRGCISFTSITHQQSRGVRNVFFLDQGELLERWRVRHRRVESAEDPDRRVERFECLFLDDRGEPLADAAG